MNNLTVIDNVVNSASKEFGSTIAQYKWDLIPDSQLYAAKKALTKSDYLAKIATSSPDDVNSSLMQSAILGLDLTEGKRQGWLLPRKNQAGKTVICLQVGYKGVEAIHQRMGVIDRLVIRTVRENDVFEWSGDDQVKPTHTADWFKSDDDRGVISGAYAITYYPDKTINVVVSAASYIFEKHRDRSESYKSYKTKKENNKFAYPPPWVSDEQAMIEKTMAYIAAKQWPANIRDDDRSSKILETLFETDTSDYSLEPVLGQTCGEILDIVKLTKAVAFIKEIIDADITEEERTETLKKVSLKLDNDETLWVIGKLHDKAPETKRKYKNIYGDYINPIEGNNDE